MTSLRIGYSLLQTWVTAAVGLLLVLDVVAVVGSLALAVVPQTAPFETGWFGPHPPLAQVGRRARSGVSGADGRADSSEQPVPAITTAVVRSIGCPWLPQQQHIPESRDHGCR